MLSPPQFSDDGRGLVVFIPGLWLHSCSWRPWAELFHGSGYDCVVVGWQVRA
ncbi:MAG: hypothetical protein QOD41_641 [Cryptosporangiaceae bacterium]|nr:hypothetical protein [Cryptosporangiaceae bacterium]